VNKRSDLSLKKIEIIEKEVDLLIIGGGTAGCYAGYTAKIEKPDLKVLIIEKAHFERSGCLAAGINAINAYLNPGETPETFLEYVKKDSAGLVRDDLVLSIARGLNRVTKKVEEWGLPILKDEQGNYVPRGKRSIRINGERIKPIIARAVKKAGVEVLNRTVATNYLVIDGKVVGAYAFDVRKGTFYVLKAKAVICTTGGASGLYRPNNGGSSRHKMWYSPFNTGAGYAMGIRAGAEMTTFEMRFIALRVSDVIAPTGTLAQGVKAVQINSLQEPYLKEYGRASTPVRLWATIEENKAGRGPCYLDTTHLTEEQGRNLKEAYLNMCPGTVLLWANQGRKPQDAPIEITGSEPYVVGGHGQAGYWIDEGRQTTLPGLFAAGDVAGGAPKKYVTGCFVEGEIAAQSALKYITQNEKSDINTESSESQTAIEYERVYKPFLQPGSISSEDLEERLQKIMDEYAGGISSNYELYENKLILARQFLKEINSLSSHLKATEFHQLLEAHEIIDRIKVAQVLVEHLLYRKETRWLCYQSRIDYPKRDDQNWFKFVNSVYEPQKDEIKIIERKDSLVGGGVNVD